jgi:hypothetical protein
MVTDLTGAVARGRANHLDGQNRRPVLHRSDGADPVTDVTIAGASGRACVDSRSGSGAEPAASAVAGPAPGAVGSKRPMERE